MANDEKQMHAEAEFETLCSALDSRDWKYSRDQEKLTVECGARGDDLPIDIKIEIDVKRQLVILMSHLPFVIKEDKRLDVCIAIAAINNQLVNGCFDFSVTNGHIFFRMVNSITDSSLDEAVYLYMLLCSCRTIDEYNDKLFMVGKNVLSIEQFLADLNK